MRCYLYCFCAQRRELVLVFLARSCGPLLSPNTAASTLRCFGLAVVCARRCSMRTDVVLHLALCIIAPFVCVSLPKQRVPCGYRSSVPVWSLNFKCAQILVVVSCLVYPGSLWLFSLSELPSDFGNKPAKLHVVCPDNGTEPLPTN